VYDHYIGLDWAQQNMAIARMTKHANKISSVDVKTDIRDLKFYLKQLKGRKILTFEESCPAQWLYTELRPCVDEIVVCDPYRNHLLKEGVKTDIADAERLVQLLRSNLLKPVFHCTDEFIKLRKLISGYTDVVRSSTQAKNQRSSLYRAQGKSTKQNLLGQYENFVLTGIENRITLCEEERKDYGIVFSEVLETNKVVKNLTTIPGIGIVGAITMVGLVVDPKRFKNKSKFLIYTGLRKLDAMSGGKSYGKRVPRHNRQLKEVFKTAALTSTRVAKQNNLLRKYYDYLVTKRRYKDYEARHNVAQRIAVLTLGVMKSGKPFDKKLLERKFNDLIN